MIVGQAEIVPPPGHGLRMALLAIALLIAAFIVKSLPIRAVRWVVIVVVLYTALTLLEAWRRELLSIHSRSTGAS